MPNKTVTAVMLTADRPYMTSRAVSFFIKQTYPWLRLLVLDTGKVPYRMDTWGPHQNITYKYQDKSVLGKSTLGDLRNLANSLAGPCDYLVHWDSDDVSHPSRVERQVTALDERPDLDGVGFSDMLFYGSLTREAWLYESDGLQMPGSGLMYKRCAWITNQFRPLTVGEDIFFQVGMKFKGMTSLEGGRGGALMFATVHNTNTASKIPDQPGTQWTRRPDFDSWCGAQV